MVPRWRLWEDRDRMSQKWYLKTEVIIHLYSDSPIMIQVYNINEEEAEKMILNSLNGMSKFW